MLQASNPKELGFLPDRLDRIGAFIQKKYLDTGLLPHAALLIGRADEVAYLWTSGVEQDAIFRIASMTKPVTSVALMQLVEQGLIALNDPVAKYIPEFAKLGVYQGGGGNTPFLTRPLATPLRVIDLLRHTAGFSYGFQEMSNVDAVLDALERRVAGLGGLGRFAVAPALQEIRHRPVLLGQFVTLQNRQRLLERRGVRRKGPARDHIQRVAHHVPVGRVAPLGVAAGARFHPAPADEVAHGLYSRSSSRHDNASEGASRSRLNVEGSRVKRQAGETKKLPAAHTRASNLGSRVM